MVWSLSVLLGGSWVLIGFFIFIIQAERIRNRQLEHDNRRLLQRVASHYALVLGQEKPFYDDQNLPPANEVEALKAQARPFVPRRPHPLSYQEQQLQKQWEASRPNPQNLKPKDEGIV